jgi:hypothetical protein
MFLKWLRHVDTRDLILIFAGLLGLVVVVSIGYAKYTRDQEKRDIAYQQALREQQQQEARRQALAEQKRREAQRIKAERERETQRQIEEAARRQREAQERQRLAKLDHLRQLGVRGVSIEAAATDPFRNFGIWLKITSEPAHAEVFFNWNSLGSTPLWLNSERLSGFLVVAKDGHDAWYGQITYHENQEFTARLSPRPPPTSTRLALFPATDLTHRVWSFLRADLLKYGFTVVGAEDADEFQRIERDAGGLANPGFRAWARAKYGSDFLLRASVREQSRGLNVASSALADTLRVFVDIEFDLYDLATGEQMALITATASTFATHHERGLHEALAAAVADAGPELQEALKQTSK